MCSKISFNSQNIQRSILKTKINSLPLTLIFDHFRMYKNLILIGVFIVLNNVFPIITDCPRPYSHCNLGKEGFINVHIVPHTHVNEDSFE